MLRQRVVGSSDAGFLSNSYVSSIHPNCPACQQLCSHLGTHGDCAQCVSKFAHLPAPSSSLRKQKVWVKKKVPKLKKEDLLGWKETAKNKSLDRSFEFEIEAQRDKLLVQLELANQKVGQQQDELRRLQLQLQGRERALSQNQREITVTLGKFKAQQEQNNRIKQQFMLLKSSFQSCSATTKSQQKKIEELETIVSKERVAMLELQGKRNNSQKFFQMQTKQRQAQYAQRERNLVAALQTKQMQFRNLLSELQHSQSQLQEFESVIRKALVQDSANRETINQLYLQVQQLNQQLERQRLLHEDRVSIKCFKIQSESQSLKEQLNIMQSRVKTREEQLNQKIKDLTARANELRSRLGESGDQLKRKEEEVTQISNQLRLEREKRTRAEETLMGLQRYDRQSEEIRVQNQELRYCIQNCKFSHHNLAQNYQQLRIENEQRESQQKRLALEIEELKTQGSNLLILLEKERLRGQFLAQKEALSRSEVESANLRILKHEERMEQWERKCQQKDSLIASKNDTVSKLSEKVQHLQYAQHYAQMECARLKEENNYLRIQWRETQRVAAEEKQLLASISQQIRKKIPRQWNEEQTQLEERNKEVQRLVAQKEEVLVKLKQEMRQLKDKNIELSFELSHRADLIKHLNGNYERKIEEMNRAQATQRGEQERLRAQLAERSAILSALQLEERNCSEKAKQLLRQLSEAVETNQLAEGDKARLSETIQLLRRRLEEVSNQLIARDAQLLKERDKAKLLQFTNQDLNYKIRQGQSKVKALEEMLRKTQSSLSETQQEKAQRFKEENMKSIKAGEQDRNKERALSIEVNSLRSHCSQIQKQLCSTKDKFEQLTVRSNSLLEELAQWKSRNNELARKSKERRLEMQSMENNMLELSDKNRSLEQKVYHLKQQNHKCRDQVRQSEISLAKLKFEAEAAARKSEQQSAKIIALQKQLDRAFKHDKEDWTHLPNKAKKFDQEEVRQNFGVVKLTQLLSVQKLQKQRYKQETIKLGERIRVLQKEVSEANKMIKELKARCSEVDSSSKSQEEVSKGKSALMKVHQQLMGKREEVRRLKRENEELRERIQEKEQLSAARQSLVTQVASLKSQTIVLQEQLARRKSDQMQLQSQVQSLKEANVVLTESVARLKNEGQCKDQQLQRVRQDKLRLNNQLIQLQQVESDTKQSLQLTKSRHKREIDSLKRQIDELTLLVDELEGRKGRRGRSREGVKARPSAKSGQSQSRVGSESEAMDKFMAKLQSQLHMREQQINKLKQQYLSEERNSQDLSSQFVDWVQHD